MSEFKGIVVDRDKVLLEIATLLKGIAVFDAERREFILIKEFKLSGKEQVLWALLERVVAHDLGLLETSSMSRKELGARTGFKNNVVRARVKDLRDGGLVDSMQEGEILTLRGLIRCREIVQAMQKVSEQ